MAESKLDLGPDNDFGRPHVMNSDGDNVSWEPMLQGDGLDGLQVLNPDAWERDGDTVRGTATQGKGGGCLSMGDAEWTNFECSFHGTLLDGGYLDFQFRRHPDNPGEGYSFEMLYGWQVMAICKYGTDSWRKLSAVNYPIERGREYNIIVAARDQSLTSYIDGKLLNQVTDDTYPCGGIRMTLHRRNIVQYRNPRIRLLT
jgi:hypothetical protein